MLETIEEAAKEAAGNWRKFESFGWDGSYQLEEPDQYMIWTTSSRDSGLLEKSNEAAILLIMKPFIDEEIDEESDETCWTESHNHWAVGYTNALVVRVYGKDKKITPAFKEVYKIQKKLEGYLILDEEDLFNRELGATYENLTEASRGLGYVLPKNWEVSVYEWLSNNKPEEVEARDDGGGWPSDEGLKGAFERLGYARED